MRFIIINLFYLVLTVIPLETWAQCAEKTQKSALIELFEQTQQEYFPELSDYEIRYREFSGKSYYFKTDFKRVTIPKSPYKRVYHLLINRKVYDCPPSQAALQAIMIHELTHIQDYVQMRGFELSLFLFSLIPRSQICQYERKTDENVLKMGHAQGLKEFREWIYPKLSKRALRIKRKMYYTPEEIDAWPNL